MIARVLCGLPLLVLALALPIALLPACSSGGRTTNAESEGGTADPGTTTADGGTTRDGAVSADGAPLPPNDCKLGEITGVPDVTPSFVIYEPPAAVPPPMTGGTLSGNYRVEHAIVYLPSATKGLADTSKSMGTVNAWAIFDGTNYRMYMKSHLSIYSVVGAQNQDANVISQGGYTATGSAVALDFACDATPPSPADYSFTDDGSGRAVILIKTATQYGDSYLELDAVKQ